MEHTRLTTPQILNIQQITFIKTPVNECLNIFGNYPLICTERMTTNVFIVKTIDIVRFLDWQLCAPAYLELRSSVTALGPKRLEN